MQPDEAKKILDFHALLAEKSANTADLHDLLESLIHETISFLNASSGSILVYEPQENCLRLYVSSQHPRIENSSNGPVARIATDEGVSGQVFSSGKAIVVNDLKAASQSVQLHNRSDGGSFLSLPLKVSNRIIGVMNFNRDENMPGFSEADLEKLTSVDATIAGLIEKERLLEKISENRREMSGLYTLSSILSSSTDFYAGLETFLDGLSEQLGLERSAIIRIGTSHERILNSSEDVPKFEVLASHELKTEQLEKMFLSVSSRLKAQLNKAWPEFDPDKQQIDEPLSLTFMENDQPRELFCLPLIVEEQPSHLLLVSRRYLSDDTEQARKHYRFLFLISQNLGMALEKERMIQRIQEDQDMLFKSVTRNRIFLEISKDLASTLDPYIILQKAFDQFRNVISYTSIAILLFDDLDDSYRIIVQPSESISKAYQKKLTDHLCEVFKEYPSDPQLTDENLNKHVLFKPHITGKKPTTDFKQTLYLPIIIGERVAGLIHLARAEDEAFTIEEFDVTSQFTGIFITSIKNALIHKRTEKLAFTDPLTGLFNHRYFQETLSHEFIRAKRYDKPLSLMVIDIDFFKKFNDTYGHLVGDKVLRHVAGIFTHSIREQIDTVARYGGEEFAVILPETTLEGGEQFAERIRSKVEETRIIEDDMVLSVKLSIGVSCTSVTKCEKTSDLIEAADIALYRAKDNGRNQVLTYKESTINNGSHD